MSCGPSRARRYGDDTRETSEGFQSTGTVFVAVRSATMVTITIAGLPATIAAGATRSITAKHTCGTSAMIIAASMPQRMKY